MATPTANALSFVQANFWTVFVPIADVFISAAATVHVLLFKRDTRSSIGWIGLIWFSPILGTLFYVLLGINRVKMKARSLRRRQPPPPPMPGIAEPLDRLSEALGEDGRHLVPLARLVGQATGQPLLGGNRIYPMLGGAVTYPAMLRAIESAERTIALGSYIFNDDRTGRRFAEALGAARRRGVEIRVLIDAVGARQGGSSIDHTLTRMEIPVGKFIPTFTLRWWRYSNLRNHTKILVVDGKVGFTGGMNILDDYNPSLDPPAARPKTDTHFEVHGPVVAALQQEFAKNWLFTTGEPLEGPDWFPRLEPGGTTLARGIADGPDDDTDPLEHTILGAIAAARRSIRIITPYFIPDDPISSALSVAAMRGVEVDILLPSQNNQKLVQWASAPLMEPILEDGCRVWSTPPPFDHTKLMLVDDLWCLIGSANWDTRSLRLNFEFCLECYDPAFARIVRPHFEAKLAASAPITLEGIQGRSIPIKLRDSLARLMSPYL